MKAKRFISTAFALFAVLALPSVATSARSRIKSSFLGFVPGREKQCPARWTIAVVSLIKQHW